jgi:hypothetical protein
VVTCAEDADALCAAIAAAHPGSAPLPAPPSAADVRWAASVLLSRAFYLEDVHDSADAAADAADADDDAGNEDDDGEEYDEDEEEDDAQFAANSTLALVPWADRRVCVRECFHAALDSDAHYPHLSCCTALLLAHAPLC